MFKILHVIDDDKFIDLVLPRYFFNGCENQIIYIKKKFTYTGKYADITKWVKPESKHWFKDVVGNLSELNIIIVYNLTYEKALFINALSKKPVIIWHFFGTEIYNQTSLSKYNFTERTRKICTPEIKEILKKRLKEKVDLGKQLFKGDFSFLTEVQKAILTVDYFAWYNEDEYNYLKSHVTTLPEFLQIPVTTTFPEPDYSAKAESKILVGNSSAPGNNHVDIFILLEELQYKGEVIVPFGYGYNSVYRENIMQIMKGLSIDIHILEDFMPYQEYLHLLNTVTTAVFNSYRQMALGNIFMLLFYGAKIFLSENNPTYPWLKKLGFHIYSVEKDLEKALKSGDLKLGEEQMLYNNALYIKMADKSHLNKFIAQLPGLVKTRK
ncbi:TDP-N-acetylfucosamine:lipid II N-acetylfucosaminyltransferase [Pontibacter sp. 172403-2]|uniref:TDP-N-acetylfucosamine:lipid II N-acetylfucosaminyltransferase n=1 Tax=Pontibacter rufus TaxID=2791028 RepID=UPI0018AFE690|nr:TDP-N-acetylfucosamine:lipid II N-acetylfucosaminyltransferase [Pontibacter sp. 172403-2]MBF9253842.1 TDP-N-acetylfucosamine:lipid II N-acetylfucosaminyltransferase [Pontibacter sp. 172403-2]